MGVAFAVLLITGIPLWFPWMAGAGVKAKRITVIRVPGSHELPVAARWLAVYLFGASPAVCTSFLQGRNHKLETLNKHTLFSRFGTVMMTLIMAMIVTPFGVLAAVYLREYARQGPMTRLIRIAVNNLAGVPSVVYGLWGIFVLVPMVRAIQDNLYLTVNQRTYLNTNANVNIADWLDNRPGGVVRGEGPDRVVSRRPPVSRD